MIKSELHPKNKHREHYEFQKLVLSNPHLKQFLSINAFGAETINFSDPDAVKALNKALLFFHYNLRWWDIPKDYLCPPIPGRADYIHYLADLIGPVKEARILDIGTGANCVYPIIGTQEYNWHFIGSDCNKTAHQNGQEIVNRNSNLSNKIELRFQPQSHHFFKNIVKADEQLTATMCNPPFHSSRKEAEKGTNRKFKNLGSGLNFGGQSNELWCEGGERKFLSNIILESIEYKHQIGWFTSLVSKKENLDPLYKALSACKVKEIRTINMAQGQKISRILAWTWKN